MCVCVPLPVFLWESKPNAMVDSIEWKKCVCVCARMHKKGRKEHTSTETKSRGLGSEQGSLICCPFFCQFVFMRPRSKVKAVILKIVCLAVQHVLPSGLTKSPLGWGGGFWESQGVKGEYSGPASLVYSAWINHRFHIVVMNHPAHELTPLFAFHSNKRLDKDKAITHQLLQEEGRFPTAVTKTKTITTTKMFFNCLKTGDLPPPVLK